MSNRAERRREERRKQKAEKESTAALRTLEGYNGPKAQRKALAAEVAPAADPARLERLKQYTANDGFGNNNEARSRAYSMDYIAHHTIRSRIERNGGGITEKELEDAREQGRMYGFRQAAFPIMRGALASAIIVLMEDYGFDKEQCYETIGKMYELMANAISDDDLTEAAFEKAGIDIVMDDPLEPVRQRE